MSDIDANTELFARDHLGKADELTRMVDAELVDVPDLEQVNRLAQMIEWHSQTVTAYLAKRRMELIRQLSEIYSMEEIQQTTGVTPSRIRKVMNR